MIYYISYNPSTILPHFTKRTHPETLRLKPPIYIFLRRFGDSQLKRIAGVSKGVSLVAGVVIISSSKRFDESLSLRLERSERRLYFLLEKRRAFDPLRY